MKKLALAAAVLALSAQGALAMDNPVRESRAKIERALDKDTAPQARAQDRERRGTVSGLSFSVGNDRMLNRYEKALRNLESSQPTPSGR